MTSRGHCNAKRAPVCLLFAFAWLTAAVRDFDWDLEGEILAVLAPGEPLHSKSAPGSAGVGISAGREATETSGASNPDAVPTGGDEPSFFVWKRRDVKVESGTLGIVMEGSYIFSVVSGSRADLVGLKAGERIAATNDDSFKLGRVVQLESGKVPYTLTVASPSKMVLLLSKVTQCVKVPAALVGCLLTLGMIPLYRSHQRMGSDWQDDLLARCLASPTVMISAGAFACSITMDMLLQHDVLPALFYAARAMSYFGILHCFVDVMASPLLASGLPDTAVARWRSVNTCIWLAATVALLLRILRVAMFYQSEAQGFQDVALWSQLAYKFAMALMNMILLEVVTAITRILGAVEHRVLQVQGALSCKAADFVEEVHAPCAELVNDTGPQLAPLGLPLLYLTLVMLGNLASAYKTLKVTMRSPAIPWSQICVAAYLLVESGTMAFAIVVAPLRISSALSELRESLGKLRCNAHGMHVQVQAVESMLEKANKGRGWGILLCRGVVVNKGFLQTAIIRCLLLSAAIFAFIDSRAGFEDVEDNGAAIDRMQENISNILSILSNNKTHHHKRG